MLCNITGQYPDQNPKGGGGQYLFINIFSAKQIN